MSLNSGEVHLWQADLGVFTPHICQFQTLLSPDEQSRAARYVFDQHRHRYTLARGLLRLILSRYTGIPPAELVFDYAANGKPSLAQPLSLYFNLSHSQDVVIYAISVDRPLGVDLEFLRPMEHLDQISRRYFSDQEVNLLQACSPDTQVLMFFRLWTAKEAYLKATGVGISQLHQVCLTPSPTGNLQFCPELDGELNIHPWQLLEFSPIPQYYAALAYEGAPAQVKCWNAQELAWGGG